jgi:hypothetical protein
MSFAQIGLLKILAAKVGAGQRMPAQISSSQLAREPQEQPASRVQDIHDLSGCGLTKCKSAAGDRVGAYTNQRFH